MIAFIAVRHHLYTVQTLWEATYGPAVPQVRGLAYEDMLTAAAFPAATYVFTDIERLTPWERLLASDLFRDLQNAGCSCLNDPARVLTRYPLLRALTRAGINPFRVWRLEDGIGNPRFPVFLRNEADHGLPLTGLLDTRQALEEAVRDLKTSGVPLSGVLGIEFCARPMNPGVWAKFGTFRAGDAVSTDHAVVQDEWCVKHGTAGLATDAMFVWERDHVMANSFAAALTPVFAIAGIEYGRADHSTVNGREVVYEINTNPYLAPWSKQTSPIRDEGVAVARDRLAAALWRIDGDDGHVVPRTLGSRATEHRDRSAAAGLVFRP